MAIDTILVSKFVNALRANKQTKTVTSDTCYGYVSSVDSDGTIYVKLDGSTTTTPVTSTMSVITGDRVLVEIKDHEATLTGNITAVGTNVNSVVDTINNSLESADKTISSERIGTLSADKITTGTLDASQVNVTNLDATNIAAGKIDASKIEVYNLDATKITAGTIDASKIDVTNIDASNINTGTLDASKATITNIDASNINTGTVNAKYIDTEGLKSDFAHITEGVIDNATISYAKVADLDVNYAKIDMANVTNEWIENGVIKRASIKDAMILGVSANKLTAGTIDASKITVSNLNASSITTGKLTVGGLTINVEESKAELDGGSITEGTVTLKGLATEVTDAIDGAIETFTTDTIPTLNNYPASSWEDDKTKSKHIGDVCYVINSELSANGYCYRFTKSSDDIFSWVLIKDSDVTAALGRLTTVEGDVGTIKTFDEEISSWKEDTDEELSSLKTRTTNVETSLGDKVDVTTFNKVSQTVDTNSSEITKMTTNLSENYSTTSQMKSAIEQSAESVTTTVKSYTDTTVRNLDIGGRNLISQSLVVKMNTHNTLATGRSKVCDLYVCSSLITCV